MRYGAGEFCVCPGCLGSLKEEPGRLTCSGCGTLYEVRVGIPILLSAHQDQQGEAYRLCYERIASDDLNVPLEHDRNVRHSVLTEFIGSVRGKKVLDIGSSNGLYLKQLDADFKVAFDLAYGFLSAIPESDRITAVCGDAESLPFRPGFFDVIILSDVLEHLLKPESLVARLKAISRPDTRIVVHVPWEEDISVYRDSKYEFAHLRSFNAFGFAQLWREFYVRRRKTTYPSLEEPIWFQIERKLPRVLYNVLTYAYYNTGFGQYEYRKRSVWIRELPQRESWLLLFYRPKFKMFEVRTNAGSIYARIHRTVFNLGRRLLGRPSR